jgi:hypothetical protein
MAARPPHRFYSVKGGSGTAQQYRAGIPGLGTAPVIDFVSKRLFSELCGYFLALVFATK